MVHSIPSNIFSVSKGNIENANVVVLSIIHVQHMRPRYTPASRALVNDRPFPAQKRRELLEPFLSHRAQHSKRQDRRRAFAIIFVINGFDHELVGCDRPLRVVNFIVSRPVADVDLSTKY